MTNKFVVCVYGAASESIDKRYKKNVEFLGKMLAENEYSIVFGAGSTGLMGAVARGASNGCGEIIGVAPNFMSDFEELYSNCTQLMKTDSMAERKSVMESSANAFIILPGGIGTLDEFFQILTLKTLKRQDKPIILYNCRGFYNSLINLIDEYIKKKFVKESVKERFVICEDADEIIEFLDNFRLSRKDN